VESSPLPVASLLEAYVAAVRRCRRSADVSRSQPRSRVMRSGFLAVLVVSVASASGPVAHGGGSTLVAPMMRKWAAEYRAVHDDDVDYASVGSGAGINGMIDGIFDFGCTDAPMDDDELQRAAARGGQVVHVPLVLGAVAPVYNLPGIGGHIRFSGEVLAAIFLGKIDSWGDPALQALNPDIVLPRTSIGVVHRLDSSGTTYVWTEYLAKESAEWAAKVGKGKSVEWPVGFAAKGNEGVAGQVRLYPGTIGYAQLTYGVQEALSYGAVRNSTGEFVVPSTKSVAAAADAALTTIPDDLRFSITDAPGAGSYPISATSWAVVYTSKLRDRAAAIEPFLGWVLHDGQRFTNDLQYVPVPALLIQRAERQLEQ
jgi:phosphate ABC transporter phosphate-binding protein